MPRDIQTATVSHVSRTKAHCRAPADRHPDRREPPMRAIAGVGSAAGSAASSLSAVSPLSAVTSLAVDQVPGQAPDSIGAVLPAAVLRAPGEYAPDATPPTSYSGS